MSGWIEAGGNRLRVVDEGRGDPVLLLHGWGASHRIWSRTVPALRDRHRVLAVDWPGFGDSDSPDAPYTLEWLAGQLPGILDALRLESAPIVAHSMAGGIATLFANAHPGRVRKLMLVCALVQGPTAFFLRTKLLTIPGLRRMVWRLNSLRAVRRWIAKDFTHKVPLDDDIVDDLSRGTYASMMRTILSMRRTDLSGILPRLSMPVRAVGADRDHVLRAEQIEVIRRCAPGIPVTVIPDCGHCPMQEKPGAFLDAVRDFLGGAGPG